MTPTGDAAPEVTDAGFTLTRVLDAPREEVWELWTAPGELTHWFHPGGATTRVESISVDLCVGGRYRYAMVDDRTGEATFVGGVYLEVQEPERLVFTWGHPDDAVDEVPVITVTLAGLGERTEIRLDVRGIAGPPGRDTAASGWAEALDLLADRLAAR